MFFTTHAFSCASPPLVHLSRLFSFWPSSLLPFFLFHLSVMYSFLLLFHTPTTFSDAMITEFDWTQWQTSRTLALSCSSSGLPSMTTLPLFFSVFACKHCQSWITFADSHRTLLHTWSCHTGPTWWTSAPLYRRRWRRVGPCWWTSCSVASVLASLTTTFTQVTL